jgi:lipid A 3-O-deacylase
MVFYKRNFFFRIKYLVVLTAALGLITGVVFAQNDRGPTGGIAFNFDNDFVGGTDRGYTGGFSFGWFSTDMTHRISKGFNKILPFIRHKGYSHHISLSFGLRVYTPDDISVSEVVPDDRPYAGLLFFSLGIHSISPRVMHTFEINSGVLGPSSGGEQMQRLIHKATDSKEPKGWRNQLQDEFILQAYYSLRWRLFRIGTERGVGLDFIQNTNLGGGNVYTFAGLGFTARLGWNIPLDFGSAQARPGGGGELGLWRAPGIGIHAFASINGQAVLRNIFLDGNSLRESHSVEKFPLTADASLGLNLHLWKINLRYEQVYWTKKFKMESGYHYFGRFHISFIL